MSKFHQKPVAYIEEVNIKVSDLDESLFFYKNVMGFQVLRKTNRTAVLTTDGKRPLVTLEQPEDVTRSKGRFAGLYHYAILLPSREDLAVFLRHLIETRYPFGASDHYVSEALYLNDPDGNGIEVYRDRPDVEWTWKGKTVEMASEQLDARGILAESDAPWTGLPTDTIMGHVHLHVSHLKEAEDFYTKGLGFEVVAFYPQAAFLSFGGYHHHLGINTWQGVGAPPTPQNSVGLNWYTLVYPSASARKQVLQQLQQLGATVHAEKDYYVTHDPSGNQIRLLV